MRDQQVPIFWLPKYTAGSTLRPIEVTWLDLSGKVISLVGLSLGARIEDVATGDIRDASGSFAAVTPEAGVFRWTPSAADVEAGEYRVQFVATDGNYELWSFKHGWKVV